MKILGNVLKDKKAMLMVTLFVAFILIIVASSLLFFIENPEQPEAFSSIPATMWWGVETLQRRIIAGQKLAQDGYKVRETLPPIGKRAPVVFWRPGLPPVLHAFHRPEFSFQALGLVLRQPH